MVVGPRVTRAAARASQRADAIADFAAANFGEYEDDEQPQQQPEAGETQDDDNRRSSSTPSNAGQQEGDDAENDYSPAAAIVINSTVGSQPWLDGKEGIFACVFAKMCMGLACRSLIRCKCASSI